MSEFDLRFTCECSGTNFGGDNCNEAVTLVVDGPIGQSASVEVSDALDWGDRSMWAIGRSYFLKPVNISAMSLSTGEAVNVTLLRYSIDPAPTGLLIDPMTGFAQLTPQLTSYTAATVHATLSGHPALSIGTITFDIRLDDVQNPAAIGPGGANCSNGGVKTDTYDGTSEFDLRFSCNCAGTGFDGPTCTAVLPLAYLTLSGSVLQMEQPDNPDALAWDDRSMWAIGVSYFLRPVDISSVSLSVSTNVSVDMSLLRFSISPAPAGLLIDPTTGFAQLRPQSALNMTATVYATISGYLDVRIGAITFDIRLDDVNNPAASGPGGTNANCSNGGVRNDTYNGTSEFDLSYSCDCSGTGFG